MKDPGRRRFLQIAGVAAASPFVSKLAWAQSYPARPVRIILPYAPGGITDVTTRVIAQKLTEQLGKTFYVENMAGASGNIGTGNAAKAAPDGYTVLGAFSSYVVNPTLFDKIPYDPYKDFDPVTLAVSSTTVMIVNPDVPAKTMKELVELVKANPGKYSFSSAGAGTQSHLVGEQVRLALGLDLVHVPFSGGAPAAASVVSGHTPIGFNSPTAAAQLIRDGKLRVLAVTSEKRTDALPEAPTMLESGYPGIKGDSWVGFLVPTGTPKDIITLLHREVVKAVASPEVKARFVTLGSDPVASTPEEFGQRIKEEIEMWGKVIRAANIRVQQ